MTLGERRSRGGSFRGLGLLVPAGALALAFGFWPPVVADNEVSTPGPAAAAVHLVELRPAPVASYDGGLEHLPATSPAATGLPLDPPETAAGRYRDWLDTVERDALTSARIDGDAVISRYRNTFAGFAARLTPAQAAALQDTPQVRSVAPASAGTVERLRVSESGELPVAQPGLMLEADGEESLATSGGWALAGRVTVRRTFTGTDPAPATWTAEIEGLPGISAVVTPDRFDVAPRGTVTLTLELTRVDAAFDEISSGALVLTHAGDGRTVRLDVTARPVALAVPDALSSPDAGSRGHRLLPARAGYAGILDVSGHGPVPGTRHLGEGIGPVTEDTRRFGVSPGCNIYHLDVPEGAVALAARLDLPVEAAGTGPELYVLRDDEADGFTDDDVVASTAWNSGTDPILVMHPPPGRYRLAVLGASMSEHTSRAIYDLTTWVIDGRTEPAPAGPRLSVTGASGPVEPGQDLALMVDWTGLTAEGDYLGAVSLTDPATTELAAVPVWIGRDHRRS